MSLPAVAHALCHSAEEMTLFIRGDSMALLVICWREHFFGGLELVTQSRGKYVGNPVKRGSSGGGQLVVLVRMRAELP
jgi:hypothetical protein